MSKDPKSPSRSRSRSPSRARSHSRSRSQSRSRSRSRKRRYSSRSRSRSHSRDRGYPREYQNNRGYRGYNRGFRRPYYYRGRNRGFYPRGRYQRGGGGNGGGDGYGGGYRPNYWHRGPEDKYEHHQHSPRRGRSRTRSRSRSRSRGSSSARSRRSYSSSSSRSPSPPRRSGSGKRGGKEEAAREAQRGGAKDGGGADKQGGTWQGLTDYSTSPKQASPQMRSAVIVGQAPPTAAYGSAPKAKNPSPAAGNSDAPWKSTGAAASTSKPSPPQGSAPSGFGFFSKEGVKTGDRSSLSSAFQKFLVEQKEKQQTSQLDQELKVPGEERGNSTSKSLFPIKGASFSKGPPPFQRGEETAAEPAAKPHGAKRKSKAALSARDLYGQWEEPEPPSPPPRTEGRGHRAADSDDDDDMAEEKGLSRGSRAPGPDPARSLVRDRGAVDRREATPPTKSSGKRGEEFDFSVNPGSSSAGVSAKERRTSRDLDLEFRSVFQNARPSYCPSELFARHIVSIVHQIKAQHFQCSGLTLNERFAMYQRRATEEDVRSRKSPEIHRRIDISPSAFKKHSYLFEEMENCRESGYKDPLRKTKDDPVDLQFEQKHRKKRSSKERDHRWPGGRESGDSRGSSQERSTEKSSKRHKKSKKSKKKHERSRSSSVASPPSNRAGDYHSEEPIDEGFSKAPLEPRDHGSPMDRGPARSAFSRIGGRGWNKTSYPGHNSGAMAGVPLRPSEEEWDPEYTPKSNKYFLHDVREGGKWLDARGRGRGRGTAPSGRGRFVPRSGSPKWVHDKFQGGREEGELLESEPDPKEGERKGGAPSKL